MTDLMISNKIGRTESLKRLGLVLTSSDSSKLRSSLTALTDGRNPWAGNTNQCNWGLINTLAGLHQAIRDKGAKGIDAGFDLSPYNAWLEQLVESLWAGYTWQPQCSATQTPVNFAKLKQDWLYMLEQNKTLINMHELPSYRAVLAEAEKQPYCVTLYDTTNIASAAYWPKSESIAELRRTATQLGTLVHSSMQHIMGTAPMYATGKRQLCTMLAKILQEGDQ